jgi:predicted CoA-binding protein
MSKIVVLGASPNPERYSYKAVKALRKRNYDTVALGFQKGKIVDIVIQTDQPVLDDVDSVLLYMNAERQKPLYEYILSMKPRRIIFNPGTENKELADLAERNGIGVVHQCALIMLTNGIF